MNNEWETLESTTNKIERNIALDTQKKAMAFERMREALEQAGLSLTLTAPELQPRIIEYTVRRPEPLLELPEKGQIYWIPHVAKLEWAFCSSWLGSSFDNSTFNRGLCYATEEEAVLAAKAMVGEME